jgi:hypothetical protein
VTESLRRSIRRRRPSDMQRWKNLFKNLFAINTLDKNIELDIPTLTIYEVEKWEN